MPDILPSEHHREVIDDGYFGELLEHFLMILYIDRDEQNSKEVGISEL